MGDYFRSFRKQYKKRLLKNSAFPNAGKVSERKIA